MAIYLQVYDLGAFETYLTSKGHKPKTVRAYVTSMIGALLAYRQTPGVPDPGFVRDDAISLRAWLDQQTPAVRKIGVSAWEAWRQWALGQGIQAPALQPRQPMEEPVDPTGPFRKWLEAGGGAASTVIGYATRIRTLARHMEWTDLPPQPADIDVDALWNYVDALPGSTGVITRTAWHAFAAWAADTRGVDLPLLQRGMRAHFGQRPSAPGTTKLPVPEEVASAIAEAFRLCPHFTPDVAVALTWRCVEREGLMLTVRDPRSFTLAGWIWKHDGRYAWEVLTKWAAGDASAPDPEQPLLPAARGGHESIDLPKLHLILTMGRRQMLKALIPPMPDPAKANTEYAPPPPKPEAMLRREAEEVEAATRRQLDEVARQAAQTARARAALAPPRAAALASPPAARPPAAPQKSPVQGMVRRLATWLESRHPDAQKATTRLYRTLLDETASTTEVEFVEYAGNPALAEYVHTERARQAWILLGEYLAAVHGFTLCEPPQSAGGGGGGTFAASTARPSSNGDGQPSGTRR